MTNQHYDYIFAGFGLSGMSLLYELSKDSNFSQKSILVIDKDEKKANDRTWSFWAHGQNDFLHLAKKTWTKGLFYSPDGERIPLQLDDYKYHTIEGVDLYNFIHKHIQNLNNVTLVHEEIARVSNTGQVETTHGNYQGDLVFRSFFEKSEIQNRATNYFLWQHFYGYVIKTKEPFFDAEEFTLMDYRFTHPKLTNFFYILPYSENEALVEFTEFSDKMYQEADYKKMLEDYIHNKLKITDFELVHKEFNAIPMTDFQLNTFVSNQVINIGSLAGYVKPSSGYAFTRTLERNKKLAQLIIQEAPRNERKINSTQVYKAFDNAVLYLIAKQKVHGGLIFASLFKKRNADFVFKFLDEKAKPSELLSIMLASPRKWEFIKYFMKRFGR